MFTKLLHYFSKKSSFEKKLYTVLGYYPKNLELYKQALTHKSHKKGGGLHNERLEFLGDAVLGSVVGDILYQNFPKGNEGFLTQMRSKIVSRKTLNKLALKIKQTCKISQISYKPISLWKRFRGASWGDLYR